MRSFWKFCPNLENFIFLELYIYTTIDKLKDIIPTAEAIIEPHKQK